MTAPGMLTRDELETFIRNGQVDTVLMVFPDLQGRLVGKRTTGRFFLQSVADAGTENCDYLIACDMDNNPVPGYRFTSYEQGYGDMLAKADWSTVRLIPWVEKTAMIMCNLLDVDTRELVSVAPRSILQAQVDAAADMGFLPMVASEIEFYLFRDTYDEAHDKGYRDLKPHSPWLEDYHILQTTKDEYILGAIRRGLEAAGVPVEFSKGEAGKGQHEINLDYTTAVEMADRNSVYKLAAKEIAHFNGRSVSFMAKYDFNDTGSSCHIHSSLWSMDGETAVFDDHHGPHGMSQTFQHYLAGQIATAREFSLLWAPTINSYKRFQLGSWAPTGVGWGIDNRTLGFRKVGHGKGTRVECRIPGSDANSYFAFAGTLAGGLYGIKNELPLGEPFMGNGYEAPDIPRIPWSIVDAIRLWEESTIARECFGDDVHHHILTMAKAEWEAFNQTVTDWELRRYWERI
ncbi:MAG: glutamine synthetase family protein [Actinomycetota bacterium]|nr:glutamine synthetase family protein [Actinomycetota bacterium]